MSTLRYATRFVNRNPRNLEMMGLQKPPVGYEFEKDSGKRSFIYKYVFYISYVQATSFIWARFVLLIKRREVGYWNAQFQT